MKFKVRYKNKDGDEVEVEINVSLDTIFGAAEAAKKLGVKPANIISVRKIK